MLRRCGGLPRAVEVVGLSAVAAVQPTASQGVQAAALRLPLPPRPDGAHEGAAVLAGLWLPDHSRLADPGCEEAVELELRDGRPRGDGADGLLDGGLPSPGR
jgi:hypothetical protein